MLPSDYKRRHFKPYDNDEDAFPYFKRFKKKGDDTVKKQKIEEEVDIELDTWLCDCIHILQEFEVLPEIKNVRKIIPNKDGHRKFRIVGTDEYITYQWPSNEELYSLFRDF